MSRKESDDDNNSSSGNPSWTGLSPLKYSTFRAIWLAAIVSNIGSVMESIGESWLMTSLVVSSLIVALTWASDSLSIVALALPAGALADIVNRRWLLIISQSWMFAMAMILGVITLLRFVSPLSLLVLIFLLGLGEAISTPAFSPFLLGTVPRIETRNAITLNGVALNIGRGIGPAVGGILVVAVRPAAVFILNALSFAGIVIVLFHTRQKRSTPSTTPQLPTERMFEAMRAGLRYVRNSHSIHIVFVRVSYCVCYLRKCATCTSSILITIFVTFGCYWLWYSFWTVWFGRNYRRNHNSAEQLTKFLPIG